MQGYPQRDSDLLEVKGSAGTVFGGVGVAIPRAKVNKGGRRFRRVGVAQGVLVDPAPRNPLGVGVERDLGLGTSGGEDESTSECNSSQVLSSDEEGGARRGGGNENRVVHQQQPRRGNKVKGINNIKKK